jgi:hypothetical protein
MAQYYIEMLCKAQYVTTNCAVYYDITYRTVLYVTSNYTVIYDTYNLVNVISNKKVIYFIIIIRIFLSSEASSGRVAVYLIL